MHSLLATLAELRVLLLTVFLSGAVHLAIFGGGWLDSEQPVALAGQNLMITVTAPRTQPEAVQPDTRDEKPRVEKSAAAPVPNPAVTEVKQPEISAQAKAEKKPIAKQVEPEPQPIAAITPELPTPAITPEPEQVVAETEPDSQVSEPVYQQTPAFRKPPQPPKYPRMARKRGIEGEVMLRVELSDTGTITALEIEQSSGSGLLDSAARKAVERWQFAPAKRNGFAVASYVRIPVNFVLE